jgi:hypothetical protein
MTEYVIFVGYFVTVCYQLNLYSEVLITANTTDLNKAGHIVVSLSSSERITKYNSQKPGANFFLRAYKSSRCIYKVK